MVHQYEYNEAYYRGLREGFDPEVAEDLGIPMSPESMEQHVVSGKAVEVALRAAKLQNELPEYVRCGKCLQPSCSGCRYY